MSILSGTSHPLTLPRKPFGYYLLNPSSLLLNDGRMVVNYRMVNYKVTGKSIYPINVTADGPGVVSRNILCLYDQKLSLLGQHEIIDIYSKERNDYMGLEDIRIFVKKDQLCFVCTVVEDSGTQMRIGSLGILTEVIQKLLDPSPWNIYVLSLDKIVITSFKMARNEKNWVPMVIGEDVWLIYHIGKEIWFKLSFKQDVYVAEIHKRGQYEYQSKLSSGKNIYSSRGLLVDYPIDHNKLVCPSGKLRGSSSPIKFRDGYICLAHTSTDMGGYCKYEHCFVYFDSKLSIRRISPPFTWTGAVIEYCMTLVEFFPGEFFMIYSIYDNNVGCISVSEDAISKLLNL